MNELGIGEFMFYCFPPVTNTQEVTLRDDVDENALSYAMENAVRVHPWVRCVPIEKEGSIILKETDDPFVAVKNDGPLPLCSEQVYGRLFGVTWFKNKLWISYFHGLTDGTGRMRFYETLMHYYFCKKNNKNYDPGKFWTEPHEDTYADPLKVLFSEGEDFVPQNEEKAPYFSYPELAEVKGDGNYFRYHMTVDSKEFISYTKENGMTPLVAFQLLYAKGIQELVPENKKDIVCAFPVNSRKILGLDNTFKNCVVTAVSSVSTERLGEEEAVLGKEMRAKLKEDMSEENIRKISREMLWPCRKSDSIRDKGEKTKLYLDMAANISGGTSYNLTYIGVLPQTEYSDEIVDSVWTSISFIPIVSMVDMGKKFSITSISPFDDSRYMEALAKQFEAHNITVLSKGKLEGNGFSSVDLTKFRG